jgi:hypothetical protein
VGLANRMAFANDRVTTVTVQATEFYDLARQYRVSGVPKTVATNGAEILGALPEAQFVDELLGPSTGLERRVSGGTTESPNP